jgi:hypothetical protein
MDSSFNIHEGFITFWIPKNLFNYNDNITHILVNSGNNYGSIFITKDSDNKLKFFHVLIGGGRTDVEIDVKDLDSNKDNMITCNWSIPKRRIKIYINGNEKHNSSIIKWNNKRR